MSNIIKMEKKALALLDSEKLSRAIDRFVTMAFEELEAEQKIYNDLYAELKAAEKGEDHSREAMLKEEVKAARAVVVAKAKDIDDYIIEQKAMMKARGLLEGMAMTHAIVPTGEILPNGVERCAIVKRGIEFGADNMNEPDDFNFRMSRIIRLPSEIAGIMNDSRKGKFNDDTSMMVEEAVCGLDKSEIVGFSE